MNDFFTFRSSSKFHFYDLSRSTCPLTSASNATHQDRFYNRFLVWPFYDSLLKASFYVLSQFRSFIIKAFFYFHRIFIVFGSIFASICSFSLYTFVFVRFPGFSSKIAFLTIFTIKLLYFSSTNRKKLFPIISYSFFFFLLVIFFEVFLSSSSPKMSIKAFSLEFVLHKCLFLLLTLEFVKFSNLISEKDIHFSVISLRISRQYLITLNYLWILMATMQVLNR